MQLDYPEYRVAQGCYNVYLLNTALDYTLLLVIAITNKRNSFGWAITGLLLRYQLATTGLICCVLTCMSCSLTTPSSGTPPRVYQPSSMHGVVSIGWVSLFLQIHTARCIINVTISYYYALQDLLGWLFRAACELTMSRKSWLPLESVGTPSIYKLKGLNFSPDSWLHDDGNTHHSNLFPLWCV